MSIRKHAVVIVGGGNAGISTAARLLRRQPDLDVAVIEPSDSHYYQPAWTLVGAGVYDIRRTVRPESSIMPAGASWIRARVAGFLPDRQRVVLEDGAEVAYEQLVVAPGIKLDWDAIRGLRETLGRNGVTSNYTFDLAPYTWQCLDAFRSGTVLFTNPPSAVKCGGAPHKIMWLAADLFRRKGILDQADIQYWSGGTRLFGIPRYERTFLRVAERDRVKMRFHMRLDEVDGPARLARFTGFGPDNKGEQHTVPFDILHVTPPQSAPDFVRHSPLADAAGWVEVDRHTLQHTRYPDVFSIGDAASLPTSRTGAAIRKQAPVLVENLLAHRAGKPLAARYNGYSSCPVVTGYGKLVLCEFDYDGQPAETFPFDQSRERWSMYQLKRHILPRLYWGPILQGRM